MSAEPQPRRRRLFGEEMGGEPPLIELLTDAQRNLQELADRFGTDLPAHEQLHLLDETLDELDAALERVRDVRTKLARIEVRLATSYENAVARVRQTERDDEDDG